MIWILVLIVIILLAGKTFFDVKIDFKKEYGVIWYSYKGRRDGFVLWGSKY